jgi:hypothetical protein
MAISRPDGVGEIANLGMTLSEAKQPLLQVQRQVVAGQPNTHAMFRLGLPVVWRDLSRERLAAAPDCHAARRGEAETSANSVHRPRLWRDRCPLAIALSPDPGAKPNASIAVRTDTVSGCS